MSTRFRKPTLLFLAIVCATISIICGSNGDALTLECAKKYLKDRSINEDILSYVDPYVGSLTDCESAVKGKLASIYSNLRNKLSGNRLHRPFVECTMRDIEEDDDRYETNVLRVTAIEMVSSWRFWSYWTKNSRLDQLRSVTQSIVQKSLLKCKGHREFGDLFNDIQDKVVKWNRTGEEEYCIRSHLVHMRLLNPIFYEFRDNPKNVRIENLDCEPVVASLTERIYKEIEESKKVSNCFLKYYRANSYAEYLLKAEVLSKLTLTRSDRSRERQDFINAMVDISYDTQQC